MSFPKYPAYKDSEVEWLGEVPEHWKVSPLKWLAEQVTDKATASDFQVGLENIEGWTGRFIETDTEFAGDGIAFRSKDILFGKLRPYLAKVWLAGRSGQAVGDFFVLRPRAVNSEFLHKYILAPTVIETLNASTIGAKMPRVGWEDMAALAVALPAYKEQTQIARFLDHETARIDALIEEQQRLIELLKEKRQALISHAVTKGLDPTVPMKDSGVDWLGEVPAHWELTRVGWQCMVGNGCTPARDNLEYWEDGHYPWLNSSKVNLGRVVEADQFVTSKALKECALPIVKPGSVLMAITGEGKTRGMVTITEIEATINQHVAFIEPITSLLSAKYLHDWLSANYSRIRHESVDWGSTKAAITCADIRAYPLPLPPRQEQEEIFRFIAANSARFDELLSAAEGNIGLLQERRSALISAAVTGKIDVRGWQPTARVKAPEVAEVEAV